MSIPELINFIEHNSIFSWLIIVERRFPTALICLRIKTQTPFSYRLHSHCLCVLSPQDSLHSRATLPSAPVHVFAGRHRRDTLGFYGNIPTLRRKFSVDCVFLSYRCLRESHTEYLLHISVNICFQPRRSAELRST